MCSYCVVARPTTGGVGTLATIIPEERKIILAYCM